MTPRKVVCPDLPELAHGHENLDDDDGYLQVAYNRLLMMRRVSTDADAPCHPAVLQLTMVPGDRGTALAGILLRTASVVEARGGHRKPILALLHAVELTAEQLTAALDEILPALAQPANTPAGLTTGATMNQSIVPAKAAVAMGGPEPDAQDSRCAMWFGKRIYLGHESQVSRVFWLLALNIGNAIRQAEIELVIDGFSSDPDYVPPVDVKKANQRRRKAFSNLRARLVESGLDDHVLIVKGGTQDYPEYTMVLCRPPR
jgi:hypothetical protein